MQGREQLVQAFTAYLKSKSIERPSGSNASSQDDDRAASDSEPRLVHRVMADVAEAHRLHNLAAVQTFLRSNCGTGTYIADQIRAMQQVLGAIRDLPASPAADLTMSLHSELGMCHGGLLLAIFTMQLHSQEPVDAAQVHGSAEYGLQALNQQSASARRPCLPNIGHQNGLAADGAGPAKGQIDDHLDGLLDSFKSPYMRRQEREKARAQRMLGSTTKLSYRGQAVLDSGTQLAERNTCSLYDSHLQNSSQVSVLSDQGSTTPAFARSYDSVPPCSRDQLVELSATPSVRVRNKPSRSCSSEMNSEIPKLSIDSGTLSDASAGTEQLHPLTRNLPYPRVERSATSSVIAKPTISLTNAGGHNDDQDLGARLRTSNSSVLNVASTCRSKLAAQSFSLSLSELYNACPNTKDKMDSFLKMKSHSDPNLHQKHTSPDNHRELEDASNLSSLQVQRNTMMLGRYKRKLKSAASLPPDSRYPIPVPNSGMFVQSVQSVQTGVRPGEPDRDNLPEVYLPGATGKNPLTWSHTIW